MVAATSCKTLQTDYRGTSVHPENRIDLRGGGPHNGTWNTGDLSVDYTYSHNQSHLVFQGIVDLAESLKTGFRTVDYLYLSLHFLDDENKAIEIKPIFVSGNHRMIKKWKIRRTFELPFATTAIAFGYKGRVSEDGYRPTFRDKDAVYWNFWYHPF